MRVHFNLDIHVHFITDTLPSEVFKPFSTFLQLIHKWVKRP